MRHAVITGDLIGSAAAPADRVEEALRRIGACAAGFDPGTRFSRFRGDGWQILLAEAGLGLRVALAIAAELAAAGGPQSRMAIGIGAAAGIAGPTLAAATGTAFVASGRALDAMAGGRRLDIAGEGVDRLHRCLVDYIDRQVQDWSVEQAEAMAMRLGPGQPPPRSRIAARLGITRQAVAARLAAAGHDLIERATAAFAAEFRSAGGGP
ncbi:MAG: hypothetical protein N2422_04365 [Rhodobacteraceae bacterium]|nr:hypothetical protein [Paracoccaceae bacterium]